LTDGNPEEADELLKRAAALGDQLDEPAESATTFVLRGLVALERGDDLAARRHVLDGLERYRARGIRAMLPDALLALAILAARAGAPERAGRLVGAAHAAGPFDALDLRLEATAREAAGTAPGEWEHAVDDGRALSWDQGLALALDSG
jgi:hypothetical protein